MKSHLLLFFLFLTYVGKAQIQELFDRAARYQHFNGVVVVEDHEQRQYEICKGDARPGIPVDTRTAFDIGSLTKQFTAAAILQLVQNGDVNLHAPINDYLLELGSKLWRKVTVHHLLTHTSGIPSLYQTEQGLAIFFPTTETISRSELISRFRDAKLRFSPGEEFSYSNSGYILLAAIIERISGQRFGAYLEKHIFQPYELADAGWGPTAGSALPYYGHRADLLRPAPIYHPSWMVGAGGVYASATDLLKWSNIIRSDRFLNAELRESYLSRQVRARDASYGYGWQFNAAGRREHDGISAGFASFFSYDPDRQTTVLILTNRGFENIHHYGRNADKIRHWATQIWSDIAGDIIELLPEPVDTLLVGHYAYAVPSATVPLRILAQDSVLSLSISGRCPARVPAAIPILDSTVLERKLIRLSNLLQRGKYWKVGRYCDGEMKIVAYSGLLGIGFRQIKNRVGELQEMTPYYVMDTHGLLRLIGTQGTQDVIFYFDEEGKVQGIFEHNFFLPETEISIRAYPVADGYYYLDGFPYGEPSWYFHYDDVQMRIAYLGRKIYLPVSR